MIIIETCPKCGHDLLNEVLACNPPIPRKVCVACGWSWTGEREEVVRVPFGGNGIATEELHTLESVLNNVNAEDAKIQVIPFIPTDATVLNVNFNTATNEFESPEE